MAKILIIPGNWYTCSKPGGGETYLSRLIEALKPYGHEFKGIAMCNEPFTHNGIDFVPQGNMNDIWRNNNNLLQWCDVVFQQLQGNPYAHNKVTQHNKPSLFFAHNTAKSYFMHPKTRIVYNSHWMASLNLFSSPYTVQAPLIPYAEPKQGTKIALVNCNKNKGAELFNKLAESMPYQFLGIKGAYGEQVLSPAVTYVEHSDSMDWSDIKLLLVPSEIESWSQAASEAIMRGIPVIASPLPGIKENLSFAGIYLDRDDITGYKGVIEWLMCSNEFYAKQSSLCLQRAAEYSNDISNFNDWLVNGVN